MTDYLPLIWGGEISKLAVEGGGVVAKYFFKGENQGDLVPEGKGNICKHCMSKKMSDLIKKEDQRSTSGP